MFDSFKIQNVSNFYFKKRAVKKTQIFHIYKVPLFRNMNVSVLRKTSAGFLKSVVVQLFPKYSLSYANLNVKIRPKCNSS